jgi:hypothetical protein
MPEIMRRLSEDKMDRESEFMDKEDEDMSSKFMDEEEEIPMDIIQHSFQIMKGDDRSQ